MRKFYFNALAILLSFIALSFNSYGQSHSWSPVGPIAFPVNVSGQINGQGRISQLTFDPVNSSRVYAVGPHGVFVSNNTADTWDILGTDALPVGTKFASICIDHTDNNTLYIGTGDADYYSASSGVWKSTDGGANFVQSANGMGNKLVIDILMSASDHNILIAATNDGVYRTTDGGNNWVRTSPVDKMADMVINAAPGSTTVYALSLETGNYYRSTDMGLTWATTNFNLIPNMQAGRIAVTPADNNVVYLAFLGQKTLTHGGIIYRSTDGGQTFTLQRGDVSPTLVGYNPEGTGTLTGQGHYNFDIEADPLDANSLYLCAHLVWKSTDGGATWIKKQSSWAGVLHTDQHQFLFNPHDATQLFNVNDGGVWINRDHAETNTWQPKCQGLIATEFYHMANSPIKKHLIGGGTQDNGELYYKDGVWHTNAGGDVTETYAADHSTGTMYYVSSGKKRNIDTSPTASRASYGLPNAAAGTDRFAASFHNTNVAYVGQANFGVYRTFNLQTSPAAWTRIWQSATTISAIGCSPSDPNVGYVLSTNKSIVRTDNALDAIPTFVAVAPAPQPAAATHSNGGLAVLKTGVVYMSSNGYVFRSADQGATWTAVGTGAVTNTLQTQKIKTLLADTSHIDVEAVYTLTEQAVYYKDNTMADWAYFTNNLPLIARLTDLDIYYDPSSINNSLLRVSSYGRGLWESLLANNVGSPNQEPTVAITAPANGSGYSIGDPITITATATDADGLISKVDFYNGAILLGTDYAPPYSFSWNNVAEGSYVLTAIATDNSDAATTSATVNIMVANFPSVTATADAFVRDGGSASTNYGIDPVLTLKKDGAGYSREVYLKFDLTALPSFQWAKLKLNVGSANTGVTSTNWQVYYVPNDTWTETGLTWNNAPATATLLATIPGQGTDTFAEWDITSQTLAEVGGDKILSLKIVSTVAGGSTNADFNSREAATAQPKIVVGNMPPLVSITSPINDATFLTPGTITIDADANDANGTITKVEFFQGSTKLGEDLTAPYSFTWNDAAAGTYVLTAVATDNIGSATTSAAVNIMVNSSTVLATSDAYVRDGGSASTNYGTQTVLTLKKDGIGYSREVYLKFDLSALPASFESAKLRLYVGTAGTSVTNTNWQVSYVPTDSWTETGVNWNNKPAATILLATIQGKAAGNFVEWDITSQTLSELGGDKILSLKIMSTVVSSASDASFNSRETGTNNPEIVVESTPTMASKMEGETLSVKSYPNPSNGEFKLQVQSNSTGEVQIKVTDIHGQVRKQIKASVEQLVQFGRELEPGTYFVIVQQGSKRKQIMLMKL